MPSLRAGLRDFGRYHKEHIIDNVIYRRDIWGLKENPTKLKEVGLHLSQHSMTLYKGIINTLRDYGNNTSPSIV